MRTSLLLLLLSTSCINWRDVSDSPCGDGTVNAGTENCDDGNAAGGDGCDGQCKMEPGYVCSGAPSICDASCDDGIVQTGETCDDQNLVDGDGCSANCQEQPGYECTGSPSL